METSRVGGSCQRQSKDLPSKMGDEELDQISRVGDDLAGFFAEGKPQLKPR